MREQTSLSQGLPEGKESAFTPGRDWRVHRHGELVVSGQGVHQRTPKMVCRVELGTLARRLEQADAESFGQAQAAGMAAVAVTIQQQQSAPQAPTPWCSRRKNPWWSSSCWLLSQHLFARA